MPTPSLNKQERKIVTLAALGGMLEFYDFIIYGVFSVYFAHQFFPASNPLVVIMQSYLVFVLGYIARPIGGIIFSHIGDEYGRKKVLVITIVLMGIASLGIGFLPTYAQAGIFAPLLLLTLRLLQGVALGGELPGTYVYITETIPEKRGIAFGITMTGVNAGLLLGMLLNNILSFFLTTEQLNHFGWRIPFIIGGLVCFISYRIRKTLHETSAFRKIHDRPRLPLFYLFRHHSLQVLGGTAFVAIMAGSVVAAIIFMPTYLHDIVKLENTTVSHIMTTIMIINVTTIWLCGKMAQRHNPIFLFKGFLVLAAFFAPFSYFLIRENHTIMGPAILAVLEGVAAMLTPYLITSFFEPKIRLSGVAFCYNVGFTLFGGLAPLIITSLIKSGHGVYSTPSVYLTVMVLVCALGLFIVRRSQ